MRNKKYMTPLFLVASFLLVGCSSDTIVARPKWTDESIIVDSNGIKDNKLKSIYDAVKALGDTNSSVLNRVLYDIAKANIGDYDTLKGFATKDETTVIASEEFKNFISSHKMYQSDNVGYELESLNSSDTKKADLSETEVLKISYNKIKLQYEQINEDIAEKLYDEIKGGTYSNPTTKLFVEKYYLMHLKKELYDVGTDESTFTTSRPIIVKKHGEKYADNIITKYLSIDTVPTRYKDYIDRKILPDLYKTYLTQKYVKEQRFSSLSRSYARNVNMIAIPYGSYTSNVLDMMQYYAQTYIVNGDGAGKVTSNLNYLNDAMIGFSIVPGTDEPTTDNVYKLLNYTNNNVSSQSDWKLRENFEKVKNNGTTFVYHPRTNSSALEIDDDTTIFGDANRTYVYKGTKLGDMIEKLLKFTNVNPTTTSSTRGNEFILKENRTEAQDKAYNEFTNNQALSIEEAIVLREQEVRSTNLIKDGWFSKTGGLTDLDSTFRERLFNVTASNMLDNYEKISNENATYSAGEFVKYFGKVVKDGSGSITDLSNRRAFLTTSGDQKYDTLVLQGSSNAFIVEVKDAINASKLASHTNNNSYIRSKAAVGDATASTKKYDEIVRDVVKANANNDTYKKNANEYYLMISNIVFYDQSVYDYFKSQFPDLFK